MTRNSYSIGNVIGFWYAGRKDNVFELGVNHPGTFADFLLKNPLVNPGKEPNDDIFWWDVTVNYKMIYPQFNNTLRNIIRKYKGWKTQYIDPHTCVVHFRVGDFLEDSMRMVSIDEIVRAMDRLPRIPSRFEILNGGKRHKHLLESAPPSLIQQSEDVLSQLSREIQAKFPYSDVVVLDNSDADSDFYRMVQAPMLVTGLGSFATMAAAASTNFRLTPSVSCRAKNGFTGILYENWHVY
mgnify:CR=1 FL=1